jgi:hypothetical protein
MDARDEGVLRFGDDFVDVALILTPIEFVLFWFDGAVLRRFFTLK